MFNTRALTLSVVLSLASTVGAQGRVNPASPESVARAMLEAVRLGDYVGAVSRVHPARLRQTRQMFDSLLQHGQATYIAQRLFQLPDSQSLMALGDTAFAAGVFRFNYLLDGGDRYMRMYRGVETVATARQGGDTVHVIYRYVLSRDSLPLQSYNVQTMLRCGVGWCANMLGDFTGLYRALVAPMRRIGPP